MARFNDVLGVFTIYFVVGLFGEVWFKQGSITGVLG